MRIQVSMRAFSVLTIAILVALWAAPPPPVAAATTARSGLIVAALPPEDAHPKSMWAQLPVDDRLATIRDERLALADAGVANVAQLAEWTTCGSTATPHEADAVLMSERSSGFVNTACPVCVKGIPCGNSCISARYTCHITGGCAGYGGSGGGGSSPPPEYSRTPEFSVTSQSSYPRLTVGQTVELTVRVIVAHGPSWFDQDVGLYVADPDEAGVGLRGWDESGLLAYNRSVSSLSATQEFKLRIQALAAGTYRLRIAFRHRTFGWVGPDGVYWDIAVDPVNSGARLSEGWHSRWVAQSSYPTMFPGQVLQFWIKFANAGTETWRRGTWGRQANLALNGDNKGPFRLGMAVDWLWDDRIGTTTSFAVASGEIAEFQFKVRAPASPGTYQLNLRPVIDGTTWLEDEGVFWTIVVDGSAAQPTAPPSTPPTTTPIARGSVTSTLGLVRIGQEFGIRFQGFSSGTQWSYVSGTDPTGATVAGSGTLAGTITSDPTVATFSFGVGSTYGRWVLRFAAGGDQYLIAIVVAP